MDDVPFEVDKLCLGRFSVARASAMIALDVESREASKPMRPTNRSPYSRIQNPDEGERA